jgi:hypothetical protein
MSYYMRFVSTSDQPVDISELTTALAEADPHYNVETSEDEATFLLSYAGHTFASVEINHPDDDIFSEEVAELLESLGEESGPETDQVVAAMQRATEIVAFQILIGDGEYDTYELIGPVWEWLFANYQGLLQADEEGFYDVNGLLLQTA